MAGRYGFEDYEERAKSAVKFKQELCNSMAVVMSMLHQSYNQILIMPFRDFNMIIAAKMRMEQQKAEALKEDVQATTKKTSNIPQPKNDGSFNPILNALRK